jgi:hypothetical protein
MADSAAGRVAVRNAAMGRPGGRPSSGAATWEGHRWGDSARLVRRTWLRPGTGALRFATVPQRPLSSVPQSPQ